MTLVSPSFRPSSAASFTDVSGYYQTISAPWDERVRDGVMRAAFLSRITRSSVIELTGEPAASEVLERLAQEEVLVRRDRNQPAALIYEPAFRAHLRDLARRALQPAELLDLLWHAAALMERELEALRDPVRAKPEQPAAAARIRISALGGFVILRDGLPLPRQRKAPGKPLALLKALVALGGHAVPGHALADLLWPDAEGDIADARLTTTLHRVRVLLGVPDAVLKECGLVSLNSKLVSCDVLEFDRVLQRVETHHREVQQLCSMLLEAYPGTLLPECSADAWLQPCRERLATKFAAAVARLGRRLEAEGAGSDAQALYLEALAREPLAGCLRRFLAGTTDSHMR